MKVIAGGRVIGEVDAFEIGEPGFLPPPPAPMVVWDEAFAVEQLERMMRAPKVFAPPPATMNPCAEIPLNIAQVDDGYYVRSLTKRLVPNPLPAPEVITRETQPTFPK